MLESGYIKLHRSLLQWEWYQDANTKLLFLHLLLTVNYEPQKWRGIDVQRGQRIASYKVLADELKLSVQNVRTALRHLISTGGVTHHTTAEYGVFTVNNYEKYQSLTDNQQSANSQPTDNQQSANNKERKNKKAKKEKEINNADFDVFFESVWKLYPHKKGKQAVSAKTKNELYKQNYEIIAKSIENYKQQKPDWQNYMDGSTFFNGRWKEFAETEQNESSAAKETPKGRNY